MGNFNYIIHDDESAYVIDPFEPAQVLSNLSRLNLSLKGIINTHDHWDHTQGNREISEQTGCEVYCHYESIGQIDSATTGLKEGDLLTLNSVGSLKVVETPGHA